LNYALSSSFVWEWNFHRAKLLKKENSETLPTDGKTFVYKWYERFREGRTSMYDDEGTGRPTSTVTVGKTVLVKELLDVDRRVTVRGIAEQLSLIMPCNAFLLKCSTCRKLPLAGYPAFWRKGTDKSSCSVPENFSSVTRHIVKIF
jgi:hypothetical protein